MDALTLFGLCAVTAMLVCYELEERDPLYIPGFAGACALDFSKAPSGFRHRRSDLCRRRGPTLVAQCENSRVIGTGVSRPNIMWSTGGQ